jgi:hypothetical protein
MKDCVAVMGNGRRSSGFEDFVAAGCALWLSEVYEVMFKH